MKLDEEERGKRLAQMDREREERKIEKEKEKKILCRIRELGNSLDNLIRDLKAKEEKTVEDYEKLIKLLELRIMTKKDYTRVCEYQDLPKDWETQLMAVF